MITSRIIKMIVENTSGIDDISVKSRKQNYVDARFCYFKICNMYKKILEESTTKIGKTVNRDHSTMIHGVKKFDMLYGTNSFTANEIYVASLVEVTKLTSDLEGIDELIKQYDIKMYFKIKHIKLVEKSHRVISLMQRKIDVLTKNELIKKLLTLDAQELEEATDRLEVFFKVKSSLKQKA